MSVARHHAEWMSLVESSGPFLSLPVLVRTFPQGLEPRDTAKAATLRGAYENWLELGPKRPDLHYAWIRHVLTDFLEYPPEFLVHGQAIPPGMEAVMPNFGETLRPTFVLKHRDADKKPILLIEHYPPEQHLEKPVAGKTWKAAPGTRMMELLHAADVPLGLVTNGEQWMLVYAPRGETTGFASWYADLWMQEPLTLRAFHSLLHLRRFLGVAEPETLAAMFRDSSKDQQEVTDQLGYQVRQAVEMLVHAFDAIDAESNRTPLAGIPEKELYDAALTVMMRLVFLFSADERGLLLLGDPLYDQHYAVSTLSELLRERADQQGEEVLERRHDAWCRLLATFRAVHGGVKHEAMRLPAYGGNLFDPDRYPFLEGRAAGTRWQTTPSQPLSINNRVVLHLLEALQYLRVKVPGGGPAEARRLSFRALDIEQIGHVYEGLLDHTAKRAGETMLGLAGSKSKEPEVSLAKLEELAGKGTAALVEFLNEVTGRSEKALKRLIEEPPMLDEHGLLITCAQDPRLAKRVQPFAALLRKDSFDRLVIIHQGSVYVTTGTDRRSSGTHYTPRSLTEPIVQHTLDPLVYVGPAEGTPQAEWKLKSPREILSLKVCDMTCGSGAFLVQACRYLSERLVEAWELAEKANPGQILATPEGDFSAGDPAERLIPADSAERIAVARRYVADRCLYGVDINPMAIEMAKLSLWLITLQRDRPFTFLDHALKCGDSLLGVSTVEQIENFSLRPGEQQFTFATANLFRYVEAASEKRRALEDLPCNDHGQIESKTRLHAEAEAATAKVKAIADVLIALELRGLNGEAYEEARVREAEKVQLFMTRDADASLSAQAPPITQLCTYAREQLRGRRPFHWPVEFPEVFNGGGFDAFIYNPPFRSGSRISSDTSETYLKFIKQQFSNSGGNTDLCCYFIRRSALLANSSRSTLGFLATNSINQGDNRVSALVPLLTNGWRIRSARPDVIWPSTANLYVSWLVLSPESFDAGRAHLNGRDVVAIDSNLAEALEAPEPYSLQANEELCFKGVQFIGDGFKLDPATAERLREKYAAAGIIRPWLNGADITDSYELPLRYAIDFGDRTLEQAYEFADCMEVVEREVRPVREQDNREAYRKRWWLFAERAVGLQAALRDLDFAIARPFTSDTFFFERVPTDFIFTNALVVVCLNDFAVFGVLNSSVHEVWARQYGSGMKMDLRYTPSKCFAAFPFPTGVLNAKPNAPHGLASIGALYNECRLTLKNSGQTGITDIYNRFHNRGEKAEDITRLRALHVEMDHFVAAAYGWSDLNLGHGFHQTKQGERYTISEPARRTVLDRLLALNHQRYAEEVAAGLHDKKKSKANKRRGGKATKSDSDEQSLFKED